MMEMIIVRGVKHLMVSKTSVEQVNWFLDLNPWKSGNSDEETQNIFEDIIH